MAKSQASKKGSQDVPRRFVEVTPVAHSLLTKAAKNTGLTNGAYASAAISYFAERGLNPQSDRIREGLVIQSRINELEKVVSTLSNRLFGWLTQHENNVSGYLRGHEKTLFTYLQAMDQNIHEHLSGQGETISITMLREMLLNNMEGVYGRRLGEQIMLKGLGCEQSEYRQFNLKQDDEIEERRNELVEKQVPTLGPSPVITQPTLRPEQNKGAAEAAPAATDSVPSSTF